MKTYEVVKDLLLGAIDGYSTRIACYEEDISYSVSRKKKPASETVARLEELKRAKSIFTKTIAYIEFFEKEALKCPQD